MAVEKALHAHLTSSGFTIISPPSDPTKERTEDDIRKIKARLHKLRALQREFSGTRTAAKKPALVTAFSQLVKSTEDRFPKLCDQADVAEVSASPVEAFANTLIEGDPIECLARLMEQRHANLL